MVKAALFSVNPVQVGDHIEIIVNFSAMARWTPKVLLIKQVLLTEWMDFLEQCFQRFDDDTINPHTEFFSVDMSQSSQYKLIGGSTHSFVIPKTKWKRFVEQQVERLFLEGVITL